VFWTISETSLEIVNIGFPMHNALPTLVATEEICWVVFVAIAAVVSFLAAGMGIQRELDDNV